MIDTLRLQAAEANQRAEGLRTQLEASQADSVRMEALLAEAASIHARRVATTPVTRQSLDVGAPPDGDEHPRQARAVGEGGEPQELITREGPRHGAGEEPGRPPAPPPLGGAVVNTLQADIRRQREDAMVTLRETAIALGLGEAGGYTPPLGAPPPARPRQQEVIHIADERSPLSPRLEARQWTHKFRAADLPGYSGDTDPSEFTRVYEAAVSAAGGDDATMAKGLLLKLSGMARSWYLALPPGSVYSWEQLRGQLHADFQGNETKAVTAAELYALAQGPRETIRDFQKRFAGVQCQIRHITDESVCSAARLAVCNPALRAKLHRSPPSTTQGLYAIMRKYSLQEEGEVQNLSKAPAVPRPLRPAHDDPRSRHRGVHQVEGEDERGATRGKWDERAPASRRPTGQGARGPDREHGRAPPAQPSNERLAMWCDLHQTSRHSGAECVDIRRMRERNRPQRRGRTHPPARPREPEGRQLQLPPPPPIPYGAIPVRAINPGNVIHAITGGNAHTFPSKRQRREYNRRINHVATRPPSELPPWTATPVTFGPEDAAGVVFPHHDALVITAMIHNTEVRRVFVDGGSSADIMFSSTFEQMGIPSSFLQAPGTDLLGFGGEPIKAVGRIEMPVTFGTPGCQRTEGVTFDIIDFPYQYNIILGRASLNKFGAVPHHAYLTLKIPAAEGVITVRGDQGLSRRIDEQALTISRPVHAVRPEAGLAAAGTPALGSPSWTAKPKPEGETRAVPLREEEPDKTVLLGADLSTEDTTAILKVLRDNADIFAWGHEDLQGVPRAVIEHKLFVNPDARPVKQGPRKMSEPRQAVARRLVDDLLKAGIIREVLHPKWLSSPVVVEKSSDMWRLCIDFTSLNKACPKDEFPLPRIDQLVDATAGCELMSFLDAFSGYHQVWMAKEDEEKTSFRTPGGTYCFVRMAMGLKNAGATFARLVQKALYTQVGRNVEAYVDDIVVKSVLASPHAQDLGETFANLRAVGMKLNPTKCVFGVQAGKLLGFLVSKRGIEANPSKISAILDMPPPTSIKEVQRLTGRLAALGRFVSRSAEKGLPFFKTLRGSAGFEWNDESQRAFDDLKTYLTSPPLLQSPSPNEGLLLYLAATPVAVSAVLVKERNRVQHPVYYVSESLQGARVRYTELEKLAYALVMASRKLRHYFQAHTLQVPSSYPIGEMLRNREASGRIGKWATEIAEFAIEFVPRTATKSQVLADFAAEWVAPGHPDPPEYKELIWTVYVDGSWCAEGGGAGAVIESPDGARTMFAARLEFNATNNIAEYEALLLGLRKARAAGARRVMVKSDSQLVAGHVDKSYQAKEPEMIRYLALARAMEKHFTGFTVRSIPRGDNAEADMLARAASSATGLPPAAFYEILKAPATRELAGVNIIIELDWRTPIIQYLAEEAEPEDPVKARRLRARARSFVIHDGILYKHGVCAPYLRCIAKEEGETLVRDIHQGLCGSHLAPRALVSKAYRQGFYWPTALGDAQALVKTCPACQWMGKGTGAPAHDLQPIPPSWPLARWGIDLVGPFKTASRGAKFVVVAVDYFSKWVEAEPLTKITSAAVQKFVWRNLICRFGVPREITVDNGTQFDASSFRKFCISLGVNLCFASVANPRANGAVERANGILLHGLRTRLFDLPKGKWAEELPNVLWSTRTSASRATGFTPFKLLYGDEAVTPEEIKLGSLRAETQPEEQSSQLALDGLDALRQEATLNIERYQASMARAYNKTVRPRPIRVGDLVLKLKANPEVGGKLSSKWEGPYEVVSQSRPTSFRLKTLEGAELQRSWNTINLKKYYV